MAKSEVLQRIMKKITLETRLKVHLQFEDYEHWNNGEYSGDISKELEYLLKMVEEWQKDGAVLRNKK